MTSMNTLVFNSAKTINRVETPNILPKKMESHEHKYFKPVTNPLKIFFDFMYFSCICPTRFVRDPSTKLYYGKQWLPQKVICATLNILNCYQYSVLIRLVLPKNLSDFEGNPAKYFQFFHRFTSIIYKYIVIKSFWFDWNEYLEILNYPVKCDKQCLGTKKPIASKFFWYSFQGIIMATVFYHEIVGDRSPLISIEINQWSLKTWMENLVRCARFTFNFDKISNNKLLDLQQLSTWDWIICVTMLISDIRGKILIMFSDISILAAAVTLKAAACEFANFVGNALHEEETHERNSKMLSKPINVKSAELHESESWKKIHQNFQAIQTLSDNINQAFGNIVSIYFIEGLLYYSGKLGLVIFLDWEKYHRLDLFILSMLYIAVLKTSADIGSQLTAIKTWLTKSIHRKSVALDESNLVLHNLTANSVGIKGNNMFTITYDFLGGYSSLILTLFIISIQHKEE